jgi:hypothetical protein
MKTTTTFRIVCDVPSTSLTTVIGAIEGAASIVEVRALDEAAPPPTRNHPRNHHGYANGKRDKGISGRDLLLEVLSKYKRPVSRDEIDREFITRGFAAGSFSPSVTYLVREGRVVRGEHGYVSLRTPSK